MISNAQGDIVVDRDEQYQILDALPAVIRAALAELSFDYDVRGFSENWQMARAQGWSAVAFATYIRAKDREFAAEEFQAAYGVPMP